MNNLTSKIFLEGIWNGEGKVKDKIEYFENLEIIKIKEDLYSYT